MSTSFMSLDPMLQDCSSEQLDSVKSALPAAVPKQLLSYFEFFAGSGLVTQGLKGIFNPVWANDIDAKKAAVYTANHSGKHFHLGSIADVKGSDLPVAQLAWASFPCQDLSLAGQTGGIHGKRSGLVWEWLRVIDEMPDPPPFLVAENVLGLVSSSGGAHYRTLHEALVQRGYKVGAMVIDAVHFVPQSRPRIFVVAVKRELSIPPELERSTPGWCHPEAVRKAAVGLPDWVWWDLPQPTARVKPLSDIIDFDAAYSDAKADERNLRLISPKQADFLNAIPEHELVVAPGYKRMRGSKQVLELRFDNVAGCLRTPSGGSSRQVLVIRENGKLQSRLLTVRETARLMGAPDTYKIPGTYTDGYKAMGDAVAVPVAEWLAAKLLFPLASANARQTKP
ncbi:DNA cytosine methyltransferase [Janthinobacterium sp. J1-1]|uniref:DNA cytosine methyltransferase n=1 Tax=Janthinobacterium sp. J1-1 TaxID=3065910 RepID=UPI002810F9EE|nr:DNA cytosine methyltransferase [Janthinobacterium sp. J1-1]